MINLQDIEPEEYISTLRVLAPEYGRYVLQGKYSTSERQRYEYNSLMDSRYYFGQPEDMMLLGEQLLEGLAENQQPAGVFLANNFGLPYSGGYEPEIYMQGNDGFRIVEGRFFAPMSISRVIKADSSTKFIDEDGREARLSSRTLFTDEEGKVVTTFDLVAARLYYGGLKQLKYRPRTYSSSSE